MRILILLALVTLLSLASCDDSDRVVNNYTDTFEIFYVSESSPNKLAVMEMPEGKIINQDIYSSANSGTLPGRIEHVVKFLDQLYILMPEANVVAILDHETFEERALLDFSEEGLEPTDICFANGTDGYICFGNSNQLYLLDLTVNEIAKKITVGNKAVAADVAGNQIYVANQEDNTVSVVDSRTDVQEAVIQVGVAPTFVKTSSDSATIAVLSIGDGRVNEKPRTAVRLAVIDVKTRQIIKDVEIGSALVNSREIDPIGFTITPRDYAYIQVDGFLLRDNIKYTTPFQIIKRDNYQPSFFYNFKRDELHMIVTTSGQKKFVMAEAGNGKAKSSTVLPEDTYKVFPH